MPIVEIEGIGRVDIEGEVTPEKVDEVASFIRSQQAPDDQQSYLESRARMGPTTLPTLAVAAGETLLDPVMETISTGQFKSPMEVMQEQAEGKPFDKFMGNLQGNLQKRTQQAADLVGADLSAQPSGFGEQMLGGAVGAVTDPFGYVGMPLKVGSAVMRGLGLSGLGASSELGAEAGAGLEKSITGEDTGIGRTIGGVGAGLGAVGTAGMLSGTYGAGKETYKRVTGRAKDIPSAQRKILAKIADEQGITNVDSIIDEYNRIGHQIGDRKIPIVVAMSDNPIVAQQVGHLAKTDPIFRQRIAKELNEITDVVDTHNTKLFGERYGDIGPVSKQISEMEKSLKPVRKRITHLDNEIAKIESRVAPELDDTLLGEKMKSLVNQRRDAVKAELSPRYNALIQEGMSAGVTMPVEGTEQLYRFVKDNNIRDLFGKGTALDKAIMSKLTPKTKAARPVTEQEQFFGAVDDVPTKQEFPKLTFEQVDSLKRAINKAGRQTMDADGQRKIRQLKDIFGEARETMPGDYNGRLATLDNEFYQRIGIPFSKQGIKDIDSKAYYEKVAPVLLQNKTALQDFLDVSGTDGLQIARNAVMSHVYKSFVKDGSLNAASLQKYMRKNAGVIDTIPGVRKELNNAMVDQSQLMLTKDNLSRQYQVEQKKISDHFLQRYANDVTGVDYKKMIGDVFNDHRRLSKLYKDLGKLDRSTSTAVKQSLRRELVEHAGRQSTGAYDFLTDRRNRNVVARVMGMGYQKSVEDSAKLFDALRRADISKLVIALEKENVTSIAGVTTPEITGIGRRPIVGPVQKAVLLASKAWDATRRGRFDKSMKDLFADPESMLKLKKVADAYRKQPVDVRMAADKALTDGLRTISDVLPAYVYTSFKPVIEEETR
jgi:hypothetical protein